MTIYVDEERLNEQGQLLGDMAAETGVVFDNIAWRASLKSYENAMLADVKAEFVRNEFDGNEEEAQRVADLSYDYDALVNYYNRDENVESRLHELDPKLPFDEPLDPNITLEEACQIYLGCTLEEAKKASERFHQVERDYNKYEATLREHYKGSLGELVGLSDDEYMKKFPEMDEETIARKREDLKTIFDAYGLGDVTPGDFDDYVNGPKR